MTPERQRPRHVIESRRRVAGTKIAAAKYAAGVGTPVLLTSTANVARALAGDDTGTWFDARP